ncbi:MAG: hypothetical protein JWO98_674 [Frankiales bacterium]|nr:hypothetical protein [Frankiales bacterium]
MTASSRKSRGMATQALVAAWFRRRGFPFATDAGAGRPGRDILNLLGLACEVKARAGFSPLAWVKQAVKAAAGDLPFVVLRCNGQGPAAVGDWPVLLRLEDFTALVRAAGYGDPEEPGAASA